MVTQGDSRYPITLPLCTNLQLAAQKVEPNSILAVPAIGTNNRMTFHQSAICIFFAIRQCLTNEVPFRPFSQSGECRHKQAVGGCGFEVESGCGSCTQEGVADPTPQNSPSGSSESAFSQVGAGGLSSSFPVSLLQPKKHPRISTFPPFFRVGSTAVLQLTFVGLQPTSVGPHWCLSWGTAVTRAWLGHIRAS